MRLEAWKSKAVAARALALAAALALLPVAPAQAGLRDEWSAAVVHGRSVAETAARRAAERSEYELRRRHIPQEAAPALAATIRLSRNRAHAAGVRRPPTHVVRALSPYFSQSVLNQARWRPPMPKPSMTGLLVGWYFREGAVTLDDVVLFSDARLAQDAAFWAHELTHVEQFQRYGVDGFARRYLSDWQSLEREATERANRVRAGLRARRR